MSGKRVLIVGAGPTGASLSLLLARRGIEVTLVEREASLDRVFRGEGMMPGGLDALLQMGIGDGVARLPQRCLDRWEFWMGNTCVARWNEPDRGRPWGVRTISQPHLLGLLVAEAGAYPGFRFLPGFAVNDLERDATGVVLRGRTADGAGEVRGDFVIGTDGRASIVRKLAGLPLDRAGDRVRGNYDALWCLMPLPRWLERETVFYAFGAPDSSATMYPAPTGGLRVGWLVPKGSSADYRGRDLVEEVARRTPAFVATFLRARRAEASGETYFNVLFGRCSRWSAPGVLLLGDAAHPMNPVRAQGINLGLRDAIVAANHLVAPLAGGAPTAELDRAATRIQDEREEEIRVVQDLQLWGAAPPPLFQRPWFRRTVLPLLARLGVVRRMLRRADRPLRYGVGAVRLGV